MTADTPRRLTEGYLDTLPAEPDSASGRAQSLWLSGLGSTLYRRIFQPFGLRLAIDLGATADALRLQPGQVVADVGCGPGNLTTGLADAVAPDGLAIGLDVSAAMLSHAVAQARPNMGLLRADAENLPLRENCVDAACATAVIMLLDEPTRALAELTRIVVPGGWLFVMVPSQTAGVTAPLLNPLIEGFGRWAGARMFAPETVPDMLDQLGCDYIHSHHHAAVLTVRARVP